MADRRLQFTHRCFVCNLFFVSERDLLLHAAKHEKPDVACSSCNGIFETEKECELHVTTHKQCDHDSEVNAESHKFQCNLCTATFSSRENLENHELLHETSSFMCETCSAIFGSTASLKIHLWKAHKVNIYDQNDHMMEILVSCGSNGSSCRSIETSSKLCGFQKLAPDNAVPKSPEDEEKPYKCPQCNWAFKYDFSYTIHLKSHEEKRSQEIQQTISTTTDDEINDVSPAISNNVVMADRRLRFTHRCFVCNLFFVSERDLLLHAAKHEKPDVACSSCNGIFETEKEYELHVTTHKQCDHDSEVHAESHKFQCKLCTATFSWKENLEKHELLHETNSFMCKTCSAIFGSTVSLKIHLWKAHKVNINDQDDHMMETLVSCRSNGSSCRSMAISSKLCSVGFQKLARDNAVIKSPEDEERPYKCPQCNWAFKYDFSYTMHLKSHEEKRCIYQTISPTNDDELNDVSPSISNASRIRDTTEKSCNGLTQILLPQTTETIFKRKGNLLFNLSPSKTHSEENEKSWQNKTNISSVVKQMILKKIKSRKRNSETSASERSNNKLQGQKARKVLSSGSCKVATEYTCKTCMVTFQYDFSYAAHMKYHEKMKQLEIESNELQPASNS